MDKNILKIDLDIDELDEAIKTITNRLCYMHDLGFFKADNIEKIEFIYKSSHGCKMTLKSEWTPEWIVIFQLLFASDYMKEVNTLLNHFMLKMDYSNRLFTSKRYKDGEVKKALVFDKTKDILNFVNDKKRKMNRN